MPRIRYLKKYQRIEVEYEDERSYRDERAEWSGQSWLSNNAIIQTFTDSQLKQAIAHYKIIVDKLEQELWLRSKNLSSATPLYKSSNNSSTSKGNRSNSRKTSRESVGRTGKKRETNKLFKGLNLDSKLKEELLKCLKTMTSA